MESRKIIGTHRRRGDNKRDSLVFCRHNGRRANEKFASMFVADDSATALARPNRSAANTINLIRHP
jgi:hypothetical protein